MQITVLGVDEQRCKELERETLGAVKLMGRHDRVQVVCDRAVAARQHMHGAVGLLVDGRLVAEGFIPTAAEIARMLKQRH